VAQLWRRMDDAEVRSKAEEVDPRWSRLDREKEKVVYEESTRALDHQAKVVEGLRGRATAILAAASLTTGFLAPRALRQGASAGDTSFTTLDWIAVVSVCLVILLCAMALVVPRSGSFVHAPSALVKQLLDDRPELSLALIYRHFSYWNGVYFDRNRRRVEILYGLTASGALLLLTEVVAWTWQLSR
jgi:hypothetical protein